MFDNYAEQNRDVSYARTGSYSSRLSSTDNQLIGLAKSLKVYPGDTINATAYVRQLAGSGGNINNLFTMLAQGFAGAFANTPLGLEGNLNSFSEALYPAVGTGGLMDKDDSDATPKLYLNMLYFDKDMNFVTASFARSTQASTTSFEPLNLEFLAPMEGYLLIYVSNEEEQANIAYFDDVNVTHKHSKVVQEESYFPFGSSHSVSYQRNYTKRQGFKYQNKEEMVGLGAGTFDFHARMYDATLARTFQMDPLADNFLNVSPYSWVMNNPLINIDPTGMSSTTLYGEDAQEAFGVLQNIYGGGGGSTAANNRGGGCGENGKPCPDEQQQADNLLPDGVNPYSEVVPSGGQVGSSGNLNKIEEKNDESWLSKNKEEIAESASALANAIGGYAEGEIGLGLIAAPSGITQAIGFYMLADGTTRLVTSPFILMGIWSRDETLKNVPSNLLELIGFGLDNMNSDNPYLTNGGKLQKSMEKAGDVVDFKKTIKKKVLRQLSE